MAKYVFVVYTITAGINIYTRRIQEDIESMCFARQKTGLELSDNEEIVWCLQRQIFSAGDGPEVCIRCVLTQWILLTNLWRGLIIAQQNLQQLS